MTDNAESPRYFFKMNPARPVTVGEGKDAQDIHFTFCDMVAGNWRGVYKDDQGLIPDSLVRSDDRPTAPCVEIDERDYLSILQKKRQDPGAASIVAVDSFEQRTKSPPAASADQEQSSGIDGIDPEDQVDDDVLEATQSLEGVPEGAEFATGYQKLSEATGKTVSQLRTLAKRLDSPERDPKHGHPIAAWKEFLANHNE